MKKNNLLNKKNRIVYSKTVCVLITLLLVTAVFPSVVGINQQIKGRVLPKNTHILNDRSDLQKEEDDTSKTKINGNSSFLDGVRTRFGGFLQKIAERFPRLARLPFFWVFSYVFCKMFFSLCFPPNLEPTM